MHRFKLLALLLLALGLTFSSCGVVAETGRRQVTFFPEAQMAQMSATAYQEETSKFPVITGTREAKMVQEVGMRIAKASGRDYQWEFKLLDAPKVVNAFALPGGKIAVYSGLLKVTQTADGLATVMGHEVAHATSGHGNERMSQSALEKFGTAAVQMVISGWQSGAAETKAMVMKGLGFASQAGIQKFSRDHEREADRIGLEFMMKAGYNPDAAPALWERMAKLSEGKETSFLDSHPPSMERAAALRKMIPDLRKKLGSGKSIDKRRGPQGKK